MVNICLFANQTLLLFTFVFVVAGEPTIQISPISDSVIKGTHKLVTCIPPETMSVQSVSWTKDGNSLNIAGNPSQYSGGTLDTPSLIIFNFQSTDAGTYRCSITNTEGTFTSDSSVLTLLGT